MADGSHSGPGLRYLSLFSGLEAARVALAPRGWECVGVAEVDPAACAVLSHRLPGVPNLGDVTAITDEQIAALGRIDVVIGGSPCQDLSVAGKRRGLDGARSSLFHEQLRIFHAARHLCGARWLWWENVPGAFSSNKGRDFAVVAGALAGCQLDVPADGWGTEGVALGDNGLVEWAVLDSQWFGVAQRRRRVFAVLDTGDWANRSPVLLERDSLRGGSAPRREAGESVAGTLSSRTTGGGGLGTDIECQGGLIPEVAHTLRADGFDASEDGTGRGTPLVVCAAMAHGQANAETTAGERSPTLTCNHEAPIIAFDTTQITSPGNVSSPNPGDPCHPLAAGAHAPCIAFDCKAGGDTSFSIGPVPGSLRGEGHGGGHLAVAIAEPFTLAIRGRGEGSTLEWRQDGTANALLTPSGGRAGINVGAVAHGMVLRRLTPRECERLQSLPDDWTLVPNANGKPMADGQRYKMCGNTFTANVIRWIGERIAAAHGVSA
jgi:DNA (cytosine-5)-methyltransferase 1